MLVRSKVKAKRNGCNWSVDTNWCLLFKSVPVIFFFFFYKTSFQAHNSGKQTNKKNPTCNHVRKTCLRLKAVNSRVSVRTEKDAAHALPVSWLVLSSFCSHSGHCTVNQGLAVLSVICLVVA